MQDHQKICGKWVRELGSLGGNLFKIHLPIPVPVTIRISGEEEIETIVIFKISRHF